MGDDQGGAAFFQAFQRLLDGGFGLRVECRGGFVEQQQRGVAQDRAGDRDALALAAGQAHAAFAHFGLVAVVERADEVVRLGGAGRFAHFLVAGAFAAEADVVGGAAAEDHGFLRHQRDRAAQVIQGHRAQVDAIDADGAALRIVEAQQQREHRALAGAGRADQGDGFAGAHVEGEVVQRGGVGTGRVVEAHLVETQRTADRSRQRQRLCRGDDFRALVEQFAQAFHRAGRAQHVAPHFRQTGHRAGGEHRVQHELAQHAGVQRAVQHVARAGPQHQGDRAEHQHDHRHGQQRAHADAPARGGQRTQDRVAVAGALDVLARVGLHRGRGIERFVGDRGGVGEAVLAGARELLHAPAEHQDRQHHGGDHQRGQPGQRRCGPHHHGARADQHHRAAQRHRHAGTDQRLHHFGVGAEARQQLADAAALEEAHVEADHLRIKRLPQRGQRPLAEQGDAEVARRGGHGEHHGHAEQGDEGLVDHRLAGMPEAAVDDVAKGQWQRQRGARGDAEKQQPADRQRPMRLEERPQSAQRADATGRTGHGGGGHGISQRVGVDPMSWGGRRVDSMRARETAAAVIASGCRLRLATPAVVASAEVLGGFAQQALEAGNILVAGLHERMGQDLPGKFAVLFIG